MKGKLKNGVVISATETIIKDSDVEIVGSWCGYDGQFYQCELFDGRTFVTNANNVEVTDYRPHIDWEQRRYEIAKECVANLMRESLPFESAAKMGVKQADALIKELKKAYE